jgi:outer membrane protein assembly factor BamB
MRAIGFVMYVFLVCFGADSLGAEGLALPVAWQADLATLLESAAVTADLDGDGGDEILAAGREDLYAYDGHGKELWRWHTGGRFMTYPTVLPRSGELPLIFAADTQGVLTCLRGDGQMAWQAKLDGPSSWSAAVAADLNGDGVAEVVQTDETGAVWAFDLGGKMLWKNQLTGMPVSPAAADLNQDGQKEVVVATGAGRLYVLGCNGDILWEKELGGVSPTWATSAPVIFGASDGQARIAAASSAGAIYCLDGLGHELWSAPTRGACASTLSVGDFDLDGRADIFCVTQTGVIYRFDESGKRLFEVDMQGRCLAPGAILDLDNDGRKEYVLCTQNGHLMALDADGQTVFQHQFDHRTINVTPAFGRFTPGADRLSLAITGGESGLLLGLTSPASPQTTADWTLYRHDAQNTGSWFGLQQQVSLPMRPEGLAAHALLTGEDVVFSIRLDESIAGHGRAEAVCVGPDGTRQAASTRVVGIRGELRLPVSIDTPGLHRFSWSLAKPDGAVICTGARELYLEPFVNDRALVARALDALDATADAVNVALPHAAQALRRESMLLRESAAEAAQLQERFAGAETGARQEAQTRTAEVVREARHALDLARVLREAAAQTGASLLAFEGCTWENRAVDRQLPARVDQPLTMARRLVPGEHDSVSLLLLNITDRELQVRVLAHAPEGMTVATHRSVPVPSSTGEASWDALPELDDSAIVAIPSLGVCEVWLTARADATVRGTCPVMVQFLALNGASVLDAPDQPQAAPPAETRAEIAYSILCFTMRPPGDFRLCTWANPKDAEWGDLLDHGNNVFCAPLPVAQYNEQGQLAASDFTKLDAVLERLDGHDVTVLLQGFPALHGAVGEEAYQRDLAAYLEELTRHMAGAGLDTAHFALYPLDEPGGAGWGAVNQLVAFGKEVRRAAPHVQIYMDGGMEFPMFEAMAPVIDIWTPSIFMLPEQTEVMNGVRATGKTLWSYNCAYIYARPVGPNLKNINIVAEYRNAALFALRYGGTGIGFWCYNSGGDPWARQDFEYPLVYPGASKPVSSRRWEAVREGIEDARILMALRDALDTPVPEEVKARIRRLLDTALPEIIDPSFEETRIGLARYVLDARNNDATVTAFRNALMECVQAVCGK